MILNFQTILKNNGIDHYMYIVGIGNEQRTQLHFLIEKTSIHVSFNDILPIHHIRIL